MKNKLLFLSSVTYIKCISVKEHVQLHNSVLRVLVNWNGGFSARHEGLLLIVPASSPLLINTSTFIYLSGVAFVAVLA